MSQFDFLMGLKKKNIDFIREQLDEHIIFLADNEDGFTTIFDKNKLEEMLELRMNEVDFFDFDVVYSKHDDSKMTMVIEALSVGKGTGDSKKELWVMDFKKLGRQFTLNKFYMECNIPD